MADPSASLDADGPDLVSDDGSAGARSPALLGLAALLTAIGTGEEQATEQLAQHADGQEERWAR